MKEILIGAILMYIVLSVIAVIIDIVKGDEWAGYPILILGMIFAKICRIIINLTYGMYWKYKILTLPNWRYWGSETFYADNDKEAKKILLKSNSYSSLKNDYNQLKKRLEEKEDF